MRRGVALIITLLVTLGLTGLTTAASAAATNLYLLADGEPTASMSLQTPGAGPQVSVTLEPSSLGVSETNPAKYQQWEYDMSGMTASVNNLTIWVMPDIANGARPIEFSVHVRDCAQSCTDLATNSKTLPGSQTWSQVTLPVKVGPRHFEAGHSLVVKVTVLETSADNVVFAFGTSEYDSALHLSAPSATSATMSGPPTTTTSPPTTTTTTTSPATTTTTSPATTTTTTTLAPTTTTTRPQPNTTLAPTTTTTVPGTSTTTVPGTSTTTTEQLAATGPPTTPPTSTGSLDFGETMPEMVMLAGSVDMPDERVGGIGATVGAGLRPAERLGVAFAGISETFSLYWEAAVALGLLMSILLMVGFSSLEIPRPTADTSERIRRIK